MNVDRIVEMDNELAARSEQIQRLRFKVSELEKVLEAARNHVCQVAPWFRERCKICVAVDAYEKSQGKCPSTYTHSTLGKLECAKDGAHLHRAGDVEHQSGIVKWMSV